MQHSTSKTQLIINELAGNLQKLLVCSIVYICISSLSRAAAVTDAATPPGVVAIFGSFLISAAATLSASPLVTALSEGSFVVASYTIKK